MSNKVKEFIKENWDDCIKCNRADDGTLIGLPYPYTVPAVGHFDEMYYWDTYFTNKGLIIDGRPESAKYNVDNMLYLVNKYGFMPNGNRTYYLNRSQPPFLSEMVKDIYTFYRDPVWLFSAYSTLKKEYAFWQSRRCSELGLNYYDTDDQSDDNYTAAAKMFGERTGFLPDIDSRKLGRHCLSTCESGWDINPRWNCDGYNFAPVDLNSLMFMLESNMSYFAEELRCGEKNLWQARADKRRKLMLKYMDDGNGLLLDYNFVTHHRSEILSAASFYPLFAGLADKRNAAALVKNINRLEAGFGILTCEKNNACGTYQWDYPNGWACLQYISIMGLDRYGYNSEAKRIARKYVTLVEKIFEKTGNLWEKYNVVNGSLDVNSEYGTPPMMGWSAGVYLAALEYADS